MKHIYHITTRSAWQTAQTDGEYTAPSLDDEGFIHCSTREQVVMVANAFYRNVPQLILLEIEADMLTAEVKWEAPVHPDDTESDTVPEYTQLFPHVYGAINMDAVTKVYDLPTTTTGDITLPSALRENS